MKKRNFLVFPCNIESSTSFISRAELLDIDVVFASSVPTTKVGWFLTSLAQYLSAVKLRYCILIVIISMNGLKRISCSGYLM